MKKLLALTRAGVIESFQFRLSILVTIFGNLVYLALVFFLWRAIYDSAGTDTVGGMTFYDTMIYLVLATAMFNLLEMFIIWEMSRSVQSGEIVMHLLKPMRYRKYIFWSYSGGYVIHFLLEFIPTFFVIMLVTNGAIPMGINLLYFVISLALALFLNYNFEMLISPICLYTESTWGVNIVKETIVLLLSGAMIPLAFFPDWLRSVVEWLPFRAVYDIPLSILLEKNNTIDFMTMLMNLGIQAAWCVVLAFFGNLFWHRAVKKITVNGG